jgi:hypothetical protein
LGRDTAAGDGRGGGEGRRVKEILLPPSRQRGEGGGGEEDMSNTEVSEVAESSCCPRPGHKGGHREGPDGG